VTGYPGWSGSGWAGRRRGAYLGVVVGHGVTARCGEQVGCGDSNSGGGGGKEEAMWQQLHTVSSFGWARPLDPRVGYIYLNPISMQGFMA